MIIRDITTSTRQRETVNLKLHGHMLRGQLTKFFMGIVEIDTSWFEYPMNGYKSREYSRWQEWIYKSKMNHSYDSTTAQYSSHYRRLCLHIQQSCKIPMRNDTRHCLQSQILIRRIQIRTKRLICHTPLKSEFYL
jgi:hypothetical protein